MNCDNCRAARMVAIDVRIGDQELVMKSCSVCEVRWWERDGSRLARDEVLELAGSRSRR